MSTIFQSICCMMLAVFGGCQYILAFEGFMSTSHSSGNGVLAGSTLIFLCVFFIGLTYPGAHAFKSLIISAGIGVALLWLPFTFISPLSAQLGLLLAAVFFFFNIVLSLFLSIVIKEAIKGKVQKQ